MRGKIHIMNNPPDEQVRAEDEAVWAAELDARLVQIEEGQFSASDWREAIDRIRKSLIQEPTA
jgi:hypothetical protein